jgi:hypothetical protein
MFDYIEEKLIQKLIVNQPKQRNRCNIDHHYDNFLTFDLHSKKMNFSFLA